MPKTLNKPPVHRAIMGQKEEDLSLTILMVLLLIVVFLVIIWLYTRLSGGIQ